MTPARFTSQEKSACSRAMPDAPEPPRKTYGFKPREFDRANAPRPEGPADFVPPTPDPGVAPAPVDQRIDVRALIRTGAALDGPLGTNAVKNRPNEVHAVLRDNLAHDQAAGHFDLAPKPRRPSRRKRDYWLVTALVNAALVAAFFLNPIYAGAGIILFNVGFTWVVWFVMDDY
ncbi:MAG: hypothetical protein RLZZ15_4109 [Verrucomicrobiota bacterium]|jgi:hypothetical protein